MAFLYQQLEQQLREQIESGQLAFGSKLPSVRVICHDQGLSKATVLNAYARLEAAGLIRARPKSGYFVSYQPKTVQTPASPKPEMAPAYVTVDALLLDIMEQSSAFDICPESSSRSSDSEYSEPLRRCLARAARRQRGKEQNYYDEPSGLPGLRQQLVRRCAEGGSQLTPDQLVVTGGCQHSLLLALMAVTQPGDTVAVESPGFYGILQLIESLGLKAVEIPSSADTGLSIDALEMAMQHWNISVLVVMPDYATPTGACMPDSAKMRLVQLLAEKDIPVIEDDIYGELTFALQRPRSLHSYALEIGYEGVIYCSSVSKCLSRDLRIGWIAPGRYMQQVKKLKLVTQLASSTLNQYALQMFMEEGGFDRHLRQRRQQLVTQCQQLRSMIQQYFPQATGCSNPEGGIAIWLELPEHIDTMQLYNRARKEGISITPGRLFTSQERYNNCLRLSFAQPWTERRIEALKTLARITSETI